MFSNDDLIFLAPEFPLLDHAEGNFARRILVVLAASDNPVEERQFLTKVLAAANLNLLQDTLLVDLPESATAVSILPALKTKQPTHVLVFGLEPKTLGLTIQANWYQAFLFYHTTFLFAENLSALEPDKVRKGQLWRALQTMFL